MIQGVEARVNVRGTLKQPEIVLSSTPPLEQADILSLIVFNQPINSLGEGQQVSLAQRAQAAGDRRAGRRSWRQSIGNALGLDTFEINTAPDSGAAASLTVGQQVGQNLYVKVEQGIGDAEPDQLHPRVRADAVAAAADQRAAGVEHAAAAVPARAGQRRRSAVLLQLLADRLVT